MHPFSLLILLGIAVVIAALLLTTATPKPLPRAHTRAAARDLATVLTPSLIATLAPNVERWDDALVQSARRMIHQHPSAYDVHLFVEDGGRAIIAQRAQVMAQRAGSAFPTGDVHRDAALALAALGATELATS